MLRRSQFQPGLVEQEEQSSSTLPVRLRDRLVEELLRVGADAAGIQQVLAGCAAAVLRVGQALQGPVQQQFVQDALQALQEAPEMLINSSRDMKLVQLLQSAARRQGQLQDFDCYGSWVHTCPEAAQVVCQMSGVVDSQP